MAPRHLAFMMLINLIWGFALVASKISLEHFPPLLFTALRFGLVMFVLFPFLKWRPGQMTAIFMIGICGGALGFGLLFAGISVSDVSVAAVSVQLGVPFATLLSVIFLKEEVHWRRWTGIALSFAGVLVMSFDPVVFQYIDGLLLVVASAFAGSVGTILQRKLKGVGVFELQAWNALIVWPPMLVLSLLFDSNHMELIASADWSTWGGVFYVALGSSLVGHAGLYYLLQRYEVTQTAPLTLVSPLVTVFFGVILLGDVLTWRIVFGGLIVLGGVLIISMRQKRYQPVTSPLKP